VDAEPLAALGVARVEPCPVRGLPRLKLEADNVAVEGSRRLDIIDDEDDLSEPAAEQ
jgi:hypothetical protein